METHPESICEKRKSTEYAFARHITPKHRWSLISIPTTIPPFQDVFFVRSVLYQLVSIAYFFTYS